MQIETVNGKCLYTHCYGHNTRNCKAGKKKSKGKENTKLDKMRAEARMSHVAGVHAFCPTRWTVRGEALAAVINNHAELI